MSYVGVSVVFEQHIEKGGILVRSFGILHSVPRRGLELVCRRAMRRGVGGLLPEEAFLRPSDRIEVRRRCPTTGELLWSAPQ